MTKIYNTYNDASKHFLTFTPIIHTFVLQKYYIIRKNLETLFLFITFKYFFHFK